MIICSKCGNEMEDDMVFCNKCGSELKEENEPKKEKKTIKKEHNEEEIGVYDTNRLSAFGTFILVVLAVVVVVMFFNGAGDIESAGNGIHVIRSVGGKTMDEEFYKYYGYFLEGLAVAVRALGITCGAIIIYIASKIGKK